MRVCEQKRAQGLVSVQSSLPRQLLLAGSPVSPLFCHCLSLPATYHWFPLDLLGQDSPNLTSPNRDYNSRKERGWVRLETQQRAFLF